MNKIGIYSITNKMSNRQYIGQSSNILKRFLQHKNNLIKNRHKNQHLQNSWNKYGEENFKFEILEECNLNNLKEREQYYLDILWNNIYNICPASESRLGSKMSEESKNKIRLSKKGSIPWNKGKTKLEYPQLSNSGVKVGNVSWNKGISTSQETRDKLSKINKGKILSSNTRLKISQTMKRKKINPHNYRRKQLIEL